MSLQACGYDENGEDRKQEDMKLITTFRTV